MEGDDFVTALLSVFNYPRWKLHYGITNSPIGLNWNKNKKKLEQMHSILLEMSQRCLWQFFNLSRIAKDPRFERLPCTHKGTYADDCLAQRVIQHKCYIVATVDRDLKRRIRKIPGVPIMYISNHRYNIERMPDDYGAPRLWKGNIILVVPKDSCSTFVIDIFVTILKQLVVVCKRGRLFFIFLPFQHPLLMDITRNDSVTNVMQCYTQPV